MIAAKTNLMLETNSLIAELGNIIPAALDSFLESRELAIYIVALNKLPQILDSLSNLVSKLTILIDKLKKYKE